MYSWQPADAGVGRFELKTNIVGRSTGEAVNEMKSGKDPGLD